MDWKREIGIAHLVKQEIAEADVSALWSHPFPEVGASAEDVASVERTVGFALDTNLREFLLHADG